MIEAGVVDMCAREADEARLERLFRTHHDRLYALARRLSQGSDEAQDIVQDTFVRVARRLRAVPDGRSSEEAWLVRVLVNLCRDRWRRARLRGPAPVTADPPYPSPEPAYQARVAVQAALAELGARRRAIVVLRELEDVPAADIGRLLGISPITVRWHLLQARRQLARRLGC